MESACRLLSQPWVLLLLALLDCVHGDQQVQGFIGRDVTLTCRYDSRYYGPLGVCWGRGVLPNSGCGDELIASDGATVTGRASERYMLRGDLSQGDVSLTIRQLQAGDSGTYGCRVDVPGWFNDHKHHTTLTVQAGPPDPVRLELREKRSRLLYLRWTPGFDGGSPLTGYTLEQKDMSDSWGSSVVKKTVVSAQLNRATVTDLRPYSTYHLRLVSRNAMGDSLASNTLVVTTREEAPGGPPLDVQVEALSPNTLEVTWRPPRADLHFGVIQRYIVAWRLLEESGSLPWTTATVPSSGRRQSLLLPGLVPDTQYAVGVQAVNGEGGGPVSAQTISSTLGDEPEHTTSPTFFIMTDIMSTVEEHMDTTTTSTVLETVTDSTHPQIVWEETTIHEGQEVSSLSTGRPRSTSFSNMIEAIVSEDEEREIYNRRVVAIVTPVVLVALLIAIAIIWQLKRLKDKKSSTDISWKNNGSLAFSDAQLIPDL